MPYPKVFTGGSPASCHLGVDLLDTLFAIWLSTVVLPVHSRKLAVIVKRMHC